MPEDIPAAHRLIASVAADLHLTSEGFAVFLTTVAVGIPLDMGVKSLDPQGTVVVVARSLAKALVYALCSCAGRHALEPDVHASGCGYARVGEIVGEVAEGPARRERDN